MNRLSATSRNLRHAIRGLVAGRCAVGKQHHWDRSGHCMACPAKMPAYYRYFRRFRDCFAPAEIPVPPTAGEDIPDYYVEGAESTSDRNPYPPKSEAFSLWAAGHAAAMAFLLVLFLGRSARASISYTFNFGTHPITIAPVQDFPDLYADNALGSLVTNADADSIVFGGFFPSSGGHGWTIEPPITPTLTPAPQPGSLELWTANPAVARFDLTGLADPSYVPPGVYPDGEWVVFGQVTGGGDYLASLATAPTAYALGLMGLPVDGEGNPILVTGSFVTTSAQLGRTVPVPEVGTLGMLSIGLLMLRKR